jgi:hypothetical protein
VRSIKVENTAMLNQTHRKASAMKRKQAQELHRSRNQNGSASKKNPQREKCRHK